MVFELRWLNGDTPRPALEKDSEVRRFLGSEAMAFASGQPWGSIMGLDKKEAFHLIMARKHDNHDIVL